MSILEGIGELLGTYQYADLVGCFIDLFIDGLKSIHRWGGYDRMALSMSHAVEYIFWGKINTISTVSPVTGSTLADLRTMP